MKTTAQRIQEGTRRFRQPRGMTLVEIMIVVTIMASVAGVVGFFVFGALERANVKTAQMEAQQLESMVENFYMTTTPSRLPDNLEELTEGSAPLTEEIPTDPFNNDYVYDKQGNREFEIYSAGPDGVEGTEDDIYPDE